MKAYRAVIHAAARKDVPLSQKILLGGVLAHYSSPFESQQDARDFADTIVQGNLSAGRTVGSVEIREIQAPRRNVIPSVKP